MKKKDMLPAIHPGEMIREDILPETGLSVSAAAAALGVFRQMLHGKLPERRPLSALMCFRLARLFGGDPELWIKLQANFDLKKTAADKQLMLEVARIVPMKSISV